MIKLNKIYTKTGDGGDTALGDGERVLKDSLRVSAYGNVDELNASIGIITLYANTELKRKLKNIQNDLFDIGADLCVPISEKNKDRLRISTNQIETLELEIDEMNSILEPLNSFVLPGGCRSATFLHMARTICRRAERSVVSLRSQEKINDNTLVYLNRLSDWLLCCLKS
ncbi:MAG: cob(I)yrinic acid a,c-diamide adenosyltransferase [Paracoccaceae bacterium]|nr:MAG: cob(I)yrinic acid a,c-diamide adenosyltransferase [Paracoccaceae bacterium]